MFFRFLKRFFEFSAQFLKDISAFFFINSFLIFENNLHFVLLLVVDGAHALDDSGQAADPLGGHLLVFGHQIVFPIGEAEPEAILCLRPQATPLGPAAGTGNSAQGTAARGYGFE